jgi:hypothetical protein
MPEDELSEACRAYHEAGHAVIGTLRGLLVNFVTLNGDPMRGPAGCCDFAPHVVTDIDTFVAGAAAEAIPTLSASCRHLLVGYDEQCALELANGDERMVQQQCVAMRAAVEEPAVRCAIDAIVKDLLEGDAIRVSGDRVRELVRTGCGA